MASGRGRPDRSQPRHCRLQLGAHASEGIPHRPLTPSSGHARRGRPTSRPAAGADAGCDARRPAPLRPHRRAPSDDKRVAPVPRSGSWAIQAGCRRSAASRPDALRGRVEEGAERGRHVDHHGLSESTGRDRARVLAHITRHAINLANRVVRLVVGQVQLITRPDPGGDTRVLSPNVVERDP